MISLIYKKKFSEGTFCTYNGAPSIEFITVKQIHSNHILILNPSNIQENNHLENDGLAIIYNDWSGCKIPNLAIKTADCLPIFLLGHCGFALIHAGWRGIQKGILQQEILQQIDPKNILIGPHISNKMYQVSAGFKKNFPNSKNFLHFNDDIYFDLQEESVEQIHQIFNNPIIEKSNVCTFKSLKLHSYRRNKTSKRNYNIFLPNK